MAYPVVRVKLVLDVEAEGSVFHRIFAIGAPQPKNIKHIPGTFLIKRKIQPRLDNQKGFILPLCQVTIN